MKKEGSNYDNRFKIRVEDAEFNQTVDQLGILYGGIIEMDASLMSNEYWYYTNCDRETLANSILVKVVE